MIDVKCLYAVVVRNERAREVVEILMNVLWHRSMSKYLCQILFKFYNTVVKFKFE